jgi:Cytoskeletal-regulatory complex EF hand
VDILKNIWTVADQPSTSSLNIPKFAVAVRLIQLTQNGQKGQGPNLAAPPGVVLRPPFFEGVSGVSVPLPPAPAGGPQPPQQPQAQLSPQQQPLSPPSQPPLQLQQLPPQRQQHHLQAPPTPNRLSMQPQLQAPPTPSRPGIQPQLQAPPTPARGPQGMPPTSPNRGGSRAIVPQDPYALLPAEKGRYESLFAQYAKDGYLYGREAVELFSKSGVNQAILRDIWNMVDYPVDNRLDKLEFALAMHLIVCISKKNLPVPPNGLPISLKMLKQQQREQEQAQPPPTPSSQQQPQAQSFDNASHTGGGPPQYQQVQIPSPAPLQMNGGFQGNQEANRSRMSSFQSDAPHSHAGGIQMSSGPSYNPQAVDMVPPPLTGGMNISDAFEGLNMGGGDTSSLPSYVPEPEPQRSMPEPYSAPSLAPRQMSPVAYEAPAPAMQMAADPPKSTQALASNYNMGDNVQELEKLRSVLQRLQAENISLKAHLGSMSEEEKEVQKELGATVAEIGTLSNSLIGLRQQVLTSKTNLMMASAELKAAREKKG